MRENMACRGLSPTNPYEKTIQAPLIPSLYEVGRAAEGVGDNVKQPRGEA
jgi:hypothetical protein